MYAIIKHQIDLFTAAVMLVLLSPLLLPLMLVLRLTGEGEIWYKQTRVGYKNQYFKIWKFATMLRNSPNMGTGSLTVRNDPRVTPAGKYLRKSKLNEVPQLINVFLGDMSFVGPRPQMEVDFMAFPEPVREFIYNVKPGITGIGSIVFRDEERMLSHSDLPPRQVYERYIAPYKGELERWYQQHFSFRTDFLLLFLTFWVVFFPNSNLVYWVFRDLPPMPEELKALT